MNALEALSLPKAQFDALLSRAVQQPGPERVIARQIVDAFDQVERDIAHEKAQRKLRERERRERAQRIEALLRRSADVLGAIENAKAVRAHDNETLIGIDRELSDLLQLLGVSIAVPPPDFAAAFSAWAKGESSGLADARRQLGDAITTAIG